MFKKFIKKLLFGDTDTHRDVEKSAEDASTVKLDATKKSKPSKDIKKATPKTRKKKTPTGKWYIPQMEIVNTQLVYKSSEGDETSLTYKGDKNRLELDVSGKTTPANITSRVFTTINNRLKKANVEPIPSKLFTQWEDELMEAQGNGSNTYASKQTRAAASVEKKNSRSRGR